MPTNPNPRRGFVSITCPECQGDRVDEVSEGTMYYEIQGFYSGHTEYGDNDFDDSNVLRIECMNCAFVFLRTDQERYPTDLFEFFRQKGWLDLEEDDGVSWEV
jgi:ribosomal protein S27E